MGNSDIPEAFPPGTLVGERYRIVSPLARGGFGVIYVAEQLATSRRVALKLLTGHLYAMSVERLLAEARITSRINSEHIVQVYDAGIDPDSSLVFVAMELLSGTNLAELVRTRGPLSAAETAEYLRQVALGLDKVHGFVGGAERPAPIVHRDLKPANLFLAEREDGTAWVKILDFGAAKMLSGDTEASSILRGTPEYMAYEQASGGEITPATDIWAFGLIAFYLLTGRSYWRGAQTESGRARIFGEVLTLPFVPASERSRDLGSKAVLGPAFDEWFFRCVNREPTERYASAGEAARALARALDVTVRPVQVPPLERATAGAAEAPGSKISSLITQDLTGAAASSRRDRTARSPVTARGALLLALAAGALLLWARARAPETASPGLRDAGSLAAATAPPPDAAPTPPLPPPPPGISSAAPSAASAPQPSASSRQPAPRVPLRSQPAAASASASPKASPSSSGAARTPHTDDVYDLR